MIGLKELVRRRVGDDWRVGIVVGKQGGKSTAAWDAWGEPIQVGESPNGPIQVYEGEPSKVDLVNVRGWAYREPYARERVPLKAVFLVNEWPENEPSRRIDWVVRMPEMVLTTPAKEYDE
jgi:hypothetical protein